MRFILLFLCLSLSLTASVARAELCAERLTVEPGISLAHTDYLAPARADCHEYWRGTLRGISTLAIVKVQRDLVIPAGFAERVVQGLEQADAGFSELGSGIRVGAGITVIIAESDMVDTLASATVIRDHCYVLIAPASWRDTDELGELEFTMAHELFHCLQYAMLPSRLLNAGRLTDDTAPPGADKNTWWWEGSAEWFGHVAHPDAPLDSRLATYEISANNAALSVFDEPAWPFFAWYAETFGHSAVIPFLARIPATDHTGFTIAALLPPQEWGEYATAYAAFQVHLINGRNVDPPNRADRAVTAIEADGTFGFRRYAGELIRHEITLAPGTWRLNGLAAGPMFISELNDNNDPDGDWEEFTGEIERTTPCGELGRYALAGYGVDPAEVAFKFSAELVEDEEGECPVSCEAIPVDHDTCLIGIWADQNPPDLEGDGVIYYNGILDTYFADGTYTNDAPFNMIIDDFGAYSELNYSLLRISGEWGTNGNKLVICETYTDAVGTSELPSVMVISLDHSKALDPQREETYTYTCDGTTLNIKSGILPGLGIGINATFTRQ